MIHMKRLLLKISVVLIVIAFLAIGFVPINSSNNHSSLNNLVFEHINSIDQSGSSDPSVHLYVNGNGYMIFSANYSVSGISFNFDNDKTQNFTTNGVPSGTIFHLVSSPNSGYILQKWTGPVNSTSNSINVTVNQNINEEAVYQKIPTFPVIFTESGLPSGTTWYVNLSNGIDSGAITGSSYSFSLTNGTYSYTIATSDKTYSPSPSSGSFTVNGAPVPEAITFSKVTYTVTFTETGLLSGTTWYVNLTNGQSFSSTTSTMSFSEPNGTYSYTIGNVSGYTASPSSGSITVSGSNATKTITFTVISTSSKPSGISSTELYGIIGAVVAVAIIGTALAIMRKRR